LHLRYVGKARACYRYWRKAKWEPNRFFINSWCAFYHSIRSATAHFTQMPNTYILAQTIVHFGSDHPSGYIPHDYKVPHKHSIPLGHPFILRDTGEIRWNPARALVGHKINML